MKRVFILLLALSVFSCKKEAVISTETLEANKVTEFEAILYGEVRVSGRIDGDMEVGFLYSTESEPTLDNAFKVKHDGAVINSSYSLRIKDLTPGTAYYYRSYLILGENSYFGNIHSFTTQSLDAIVTTSATDIFTPYTATLSGTISGRSAKDYGNEISLGIFYSKTAQSRAKLKTSGIKAVPKWPPYGEGTFSVDLTGLDENTTYYYVAFAKIKDSELYGEVRSFRTGHIWTSPDATVNMGVSVNWATCNLGAKSPEGYGGYYAWGETTEKSVYEESNYSFKYDVKQLSLKYDVANIELGGRWRMPTHDELIELLKNTNRAKCTYKGKEGCVITSKKNGNSIFIPAAGYKTSTLNNAGYEASFWTSTSANTYLSTCFISLKDGGFDNYARHQGHQVRPVYE